MGRKIKNFCERCGNEIIDRTYSTARYCKQCKALHEKEYFQEQYKVRKLLAPAVALSCINIKEVESNANRDLVTIR